MTDSGREEGLRFAIGVPVASSRIDNLHNHSGYGKAVNGFLSTSKERHTFGKLLIRQYEQCLAIGSRVDAGR